MLMLPRGIVGSWRVQLPLSWLYGSNTAIDCFEFPENVEYAQAVACRFGLQLAMDAGIRLLS